jgi:SAM-dependent methyltransferase
MGDARYNTIGLGYQTTRRSDPRIAAQLERALAGCAHVLNVGAGTGSYESSARHVVAVEPSAVMVRQRPKGSAPAVLGVAEHLPFADASFAAATAFLTVHHWSDVEQGLRELRRIARQRIVILTYVPDAISREQRWLTSRYFPGIADFDDHVFPTQELYRRVLGQIELEPVLIPSDCLDGFLDAFWARPEAYLDPSVRAGMSGFRLLPANEVERGVERLREDLERGEWDARFGHLRARAEFDAGLRLVIVKA